MNRASSKKIRWIDWLTTTTWRTVKLARHPPNKTIHTHKPPSSGDKISVRYRYNNIYYFHLSQSLLVATTAAIKMTMMMIIKQKSLNWVGGRRQILRLFLRVKPVKNKKHHCSHFFFSCYLPATYLIATLVSSWDLEIGLAYFVLKACLLLPFSCLWMCRLAIHEVEWTKQTSLYLWRKTFLGKEKKKCMLLWFINPAKCYSVEEAAKS